MPNQRRMETNALAPETQARKPKKKKCEHRKKKLNNCFPERNAHERSTKKLARSTPPPSPRQISPLVLSRLSLSPFCSPLDARLLQSFERFRSLTDNSVGEAIRSNPIFTHSSLSLSLSRTRARVRVCYLLIPSSLRRPSCLFASRGPSTIDRFRKLQAPPTLLPSSSSFATDHQQNLCPKKFEPASNGNPAASPKRSFPAKKPSPPPGWPVQKRQRRRR